MSSPNGSPSFRVVTSGVLKQQIKALHLEAAKKGYAAAYLESLRTIYKHLGEEPRRFGEPQFRLPAMRMTVYHRALFPVTVGFGVHDTLPFVIVRGFRLMI
jgi:hypothetical protein